MKFSQYAKAWASRLVHLGCFFPHGYGSASLCYHVEGAKDGSVIVKFHPYGEVFHFSDQASAVNAILLHVCGNEERCNALLLTYHHDLESYHC